MNALSVAIPPRAATAVTPTFAATTIPSSSTMPSPSSPPMVAPPVAAYADAFAFFSSQREERLCCSSTTSSAPDSRSDSAAASFAATSSATAVRPSPPLVAAPFTNRITMNVLDEIDAMSRLLHDLSRDEIDMVVGFFANANASTANATANANASFATTNANHKSSSFCSSSSRPTSLPPPESVTITLPPHPSKNRMIPVATAMISYRHLVPSVSPCEWQDCCGAKDKTKPTNIGIGMPPPLLTSLYHLFGDQRVLRGNWNPVTGASDVVPGNGNNSNSNISLLLQQVDGILSLPNGGNASSDSGLPPLLSATAAILKNEMTLTNTKKKKTKTRQAHRDPLQCGGGDPLPRHPHPHIATTNEAKAPLVPILPLGELPPVPPSSAIRPPRNTSGKRKQTRSSTAAKTKKAKKEDNGNRPSSSDNRTGPASLSLKKSNVLVVLSTESSLETHECASTATVTSTTATNTGDTASARRKLCMETKTEEKEGGEGALNQMSFTYISKPTIYDEERWNCRLEQARDFFKEHGHGRIPVRYLPNPDLANWAKRQRYHYKILEKHLSSSAQCGSTTSGTTSSVHSTLAAATARARIGDTNNINSHNDPLCSAAAMRRKDPSVRIVKCLMTAQRLQALVDIGFVLDNPNGRWEHYFQRLRDFAATNQGRTAPSRHTHLELWKWVSIQKYQMTIYKKHHHYSGGDYSINSKSKNAKKPHKGKLYMTNERIGKLKAIGFKWESC